MDLSTILFLVTLILLIFFVVSSRGALGRSARKIDELEGRLKDAESRDAEPKASAPATATAPAPAGGRELARISDYLRLAVAAPLRQGLEGDDDELRDRADEALAAVEDMEFFTEDRDMERHPANLLALLEDVAAEYSEQTEVMVKFRDADASLQASVAPEAFKDAVYLILVNAGIFGRGNPVEVTLEASGDQTSIRFRDHGPGFSEEALSRGAEPFYTTEEGALGMGLTHATRTIREHDGELRLGNSPRGGAEVELRLPRA